jgi:small subunit ribosomal protein S19e
VTTVYDVPAQPLIDRLASQLEDRDAIEPPEWAPFARTGAHKEQPPEDDNWWFTRSAAIFRKVYADGPIGTERLSTHYGGKADNGATPNHAVKGSRNIIRTILQQLEAEGFVETVDGGREVTAEGQSHLDNLSHEVQQDLIEEIPELAKY